MREIRNMGEALHALINIGLALGNSGRGTAADQAEATAEEMEFAQAVFEQVEENQASLRSDASSSFLGMTGNENPSLADLMFFLCVRISNLQIVVPAWQHGHAPIAQSYECCIDTFCRGIRKRDLVDAAAVPLDPYLTAQDEWMNPLQITENRFEQDGYGTGLLEEAYQVFQHLQDPSYLTHHEITREDISVFLTLCEGTDEAPKNPPAGLGHLLNECNIGEIFGMIATVKQHEPSIEENAMILDFEAHLHAVRQSIAPPKLRLE